MWRDPTPEEFAAVADWAGRSFPPGSTPLPASFPVSFRYAGGPAGAAADWHIDEAVAAPSPFAPRTLRASLPGGPVDCVCEITRYPDFPAVEWVARFRNQGEEPSAILADILPLDALFPADASAPCRVHHARGALTQIRRL